MSVISVLIAHSRRLFSDSLAIALDALPDIKVLDEHPLLGLQTLDVAELYRPDVVLLDHWMTDMQGPAVVQSMKSALPECKVLVLSWFHGPAEVHNTLSAGAAGFLPETLSVHEVAHAIRQAHAGVSPVFPEELKEMVETIKQRARAADEVWERLRTLTRRELQVLALLSLGEPLATIAEKLFISRTTARHHVDNMLSKTGTHSQAEMLSLARRYGLIAG